MTIKRSDYRKACSSIKAMDKDTNWVRQIGYGYSAALMIDN